MNNESLNFEKIVKNKMHCIFVSPHLDDAALSCGGLITYLSGKTKVTVINIFTKADKQPYTLSAKAFLKASETENAGLLFKKRIKEDAEAFGKLKVRVTNLNYIDASFRKLKTKNYFRNLISKIIPELNHVYPTYRWHVSKGRVSPLDQKLIEKIKNEIMKRAKNKNTVIFYPAGVGEHVDHILIRNICSKLGVKNLIAWSDFPYNARTSDLGRYYLAGNFKKLDFAKFQKERVKMINAYKTQVKGLFPDGNMNLIPETYFVK